jgi:putative flippase GtrA
MRHRSRTLPFWNPLKELSAYAVVSGIALAVDASILWILVNRLAWHYLPASAVSFIAGGGVSYALSVRFVFRFRNVNCRQVEFVSFVLLGVAGLLVNAAVLSLAITYIGLGLLAAKLVSAGFTFTTNFALRRQLLFAPRVGQVRAE